MYSAFKFSFMKWMGSCVCFFMVIEFLLSDVFIGKFNISLKFCEEGKIASSE